MPTRLGLDIGTNSIGWCLYDGDCIRDIGVRIFSDGREPSKGGMPGASLAVTRRVARAMRRRRDRFIGRRSALFDALVTYGLMPDEDAAAKAIEIEDPYVLRAMALDIALTPYQFGRALFHLNQRRGFKSNRKTDRASADPTAGKIAPATKALDAAMTDAKARTLGEFLHGLDTKRVRMRDDGEGYDFYPDRRHYEDEFAKIWEAQSKHHPDVVTEVARVAIHRIIFFQRELKVQVVGVCTFAGLNGVPADERRLPKAHPLFQRRRLYEEVNHLRICRAGEADRVLTLDERNALILKLKSKKTVAFKTLGKTIKLRDGERFNKEGENRKDLTGDEINAEMSAKIRFGSRWPHFSADEQWTILDRLIEEQSPETLHEWLTSTYGLDDEAAQAVAAAKLPDGHGRMGKTATAAILAELEKSVCSYAEAADAAGFHHSDFRTGEALPDLPYYGELLSQDIPPGSLDPAEENDEVRWGKITNPTVHIGLNQLRKLVNAIIRVHGRPDQIVVELARELKLNEKQKKDYNKQLGENTRAAKARGDLLTSMGQSDNGGNRMLVRLWHDLNPDNVLDRRCPYCGEPISAQMLMNGSVDIDHIIPYSRSFDDGASNKVVVHQNCNRQKGNKTPWEWRGDTVHWPIIADQVARLHKSKQWRFAPDAMERVEKDGGFIARQLTDTQYLSRLAGKYLARLYPSKEEGRVYVIPGRMTAMLRRLWGLNDILNDHNYVENRHSNAPKNRLDHRHHAIDAAVIGVTTQGLLQMIAKAAGRAEDQNLDKLFEGLEQPWEGFRDELRQKLGSVTVSHKADHGRRA
ncbi:MAG: type II CRISPR RNA-guided endonuclease Cas9, partial [Sphingobium sp.]